MNKTTWASGAGEKYLSVREYFVTYVTSKLGFDCSQSSDS